VTDSIVLQLMALSGVVRYKSVTQRESCDTQSRRHSRRCCGRARRTLRLSAVNSTEQSGERRVMCERRHRSVLDVSQSFRDDEDTWRGVTSPWRQHSEVSQSFRYDEDTWRGV